MNGCGCIWVLFSVSERMGEKVARKQGKNTFEIKNQTKKPKGNKASRPAALAPTPQIGGGSSSLDILLQATDIFVGQTTGPADKGANDMAE